MPDERKPCIGFIGLGMMGLPMSANLIRAGFQVRGFDASAQALAAFVETGGIAAASAREASADAEILVTMLPNSDIVADVLLGDGDAASALPPGALVIEMSSSAPQMTLQLGEALGKRQIRLIDAPVSGLVARARDGSLAIMAGGAKDDIERARPVLSVLGRVIIETGPLGSGHAMKALNNFVSASGLVAACEALIVGEAFGLDPAVMVDVLNLSTGRNNSTETKIKPQVLSGAFQSGFALHLMAKDNRTAAGLAESLGLRADEIRASAALWEQAAQALGRGADHTEIYKHLTALLKKREI